MIAEIIIHRQTGTPRGGGLIPCGMITWMGMLLKGMTKTSGEGMTTCERLLDMHMIRRRLLMWIPAWEKLVCFVSLLTFGQTGGTDCTSVHNDSTVDLFESSVALGAAKSASANVCLEFTSSYVWCLHSCYCLFTVL